MTAFRSASFWAAGQFSDFMRRNTTAAWISDNRRDSSSVSSFVLGGYTTSLMGAIFRITVIPFGEDLDVWDVSRPPGGCGKSRYRILFAHGWKYKEE